MVSILRDEIMRNVDAMDKMENEVYYEMQEGVYRCYKPTDKVIVKISNDVWIKMTKNECIRYYAKRVKYMSDYLEGIIKYYKDNLNKVK